MSPRLGSQRFGGARNRQLGWGFPFRVAQNEVRAARRVAERAVLFHLPVMCFILMFRGWE